MAPLTLITLIGAILTSLASAGAFAFFMRYGTRLTMVEVSNKQMDTRQVLIEQFKTETLSRLAVTESTLAAIRDDVKKLAKLDVIDGKLDSVTRIVETIVPRSEYESRAKGIDLRLTTVENEVRILEEKHNV